MKIGLATAYEPLVDALSIIAACSGSELVRLENTDNLLAQGAVALVIDPACLPRPAWLAYLAYLDSDGAHEQTPVALLLDHRTADDEINFPTPLGRKPEYTLFHFVDDEVDAICEFVEEVLRVGFTEHGKPVPCAAVGFYDAEACYVQTHFTEPYVVVLSRPDEDSPNILAYAGIAEHAGIDTVEWARSAFLAFPFTLESEARQFIKQLPHRLVTLYEHGVVLWS